MTREVSRIMNSAGLLVIGTSATAIFGVPAPSVEPTEHGGREPVTYRIVLAVNLQRDAHASFDGLGGMDSKDSREQENRHD